MNDNLLGPRFIPTITLGGRVLAQDRRGVFSVEIGRKSTLPFDNRVLDITGNTIGHIDLLGTRSECLKRW